jgi:protein-disulfide isomerase
MILTQPIGPKDHVLGRPDALVTLVEYMDYECPYCRRAQQIVSQILEQMGDVVRFVPRHFPLSQIHPHALLAAQAAEAAGAQGEFWSMHATLFENQDALDAEALIVYADALQLDVRRFIEELRLVVHFPKVQGDFRSGVRSGVNGTPTFYVNGLRHDRAWDAASLMTAIGDAVTAEKAAMTQMAERPPGG